MPDGVEMKIVHFRDGLLWSPVIECHAVRGNKYAGAILAQPAMNKNCLLWLPRDGVEKVSNLCVGGI